MKNFEKIGQGHTAIIYKDKHKAVKLYNKGISLAHVEHEASLQKYAVDVGLPVPAVLGICQFKDSSIALEMEFINAQPFVQSRMTSGKWSSTIKILVELQRNIHDIIATEPPNQINEFKRKISDSHHISDDIKTNLLYRLNQMNTQADKLCHGDFHPFNIIYDGSKHWIIDWRASTSGDPLADACRTYVIFRQFIKRRAESYLKTYCKEAGVERRDVLAWLPIIVAVCLSHDMDDKSRKLLLGILEQSLN